jgi:alpha-glucosidase
MHQTVADKVVALMRLRVRMQPYLHYLSWRYACKFEPIWRPTFYDFPSDPVTWEENDEFMLGPSLLVAPVVTPGAVKRAVRAPAGADWIDPWAGARITGGRMAVLDAPLGRPTILAKVGSLIPVNRAPARFGDDTLERGFLLFPPDEGEVSIELFDDDGESSVDLARAMPTIRIVARCDDKAIEVSVAGLAGLKPKAFILPPGEKRPLTVRGS